MLLRYIRTLVAAVVLMVLLVLICSDFVIADTSTDLLLVTVPGRLKDAQARFSRSASVYNYTIKVVGEGEDRLSEKVKLHHLSKYLHQLTEEDPLRLVLFLDGTDAVLTSGPLRVVEEFHHSGAAVLLSADGICWPDRSMEPSYPMVERGRRYLNAGGMVGSAEDLSRVLKEASENEESLQTLLTRLYIKDSTRIKYKLDIDHKASLFQNLHGATGDLEIRFAGKDGYLQNIEYSSVPVVVRANEDTGRVLNTLATYLARSWNPEDGCRACWEDMLSFEETKDADLPIVVLAVFIQKATPFLEEFFDKISGLSYPKQRIHLFIHNAVEYHDDITENWVESTNKEFNTTKQISREDKVKEWHAKNQAISYCQLKQCQFLFYVDSEAHLDNPHVLKLLMEQNRNVVAPMLTRPFKAWSNFWGEVTSEGFYARSMDYMEIVQNQRRGLWNVPYLSTCFLLRRDLLDEVKPSFIHNLLDPDMAFCHNLRNKGVHMYVSNRVDFGHLINTDNFVTTHMNPELWQLFDNRWDWEVRYIHENFTQSIAENTTVEMPCPDVYWFPLFKERYATEIIDMMENHGSWSDGSHEDSRLDGGYESVPTVDIHMKQVSYEEEWLDILKIYVMPMQQKIFDGYFNDVGPPRAIMNFMVRYKPNEQPELRPHHDTSTYTINVAMNKPGTDYQGGGCRFIRYDCKVTDSRVGWLLMHPGRLTHLHEGLRVTNGTRYIVISFVDP